MTDHELETRTTSMENLVYMYGEHPTPERLSAILDAYREDLRDLENSVAKTVQWHWLKIIFGVLAVLVVFRLVF